MENINYFNPPTAETSNNSGQNQPQPEAGLNQSAFFAGMDIRVRPSELALTPVMPQLPFDYHQAPEPWQLSTLDVSPHSATQHLPQVDSPPLDPFLAIATYQPFNEYNQLPPDFFGGLEFTTDIGELVGEYLMDTIPFPPEQNRPEPTRKVSISTAQNTVDTSADEHFVTSLSGSGTSTSQDARITSIDRHLGQSLSRTRKSSQQIRRSIRKLTATETTTQIKKKSRASNATSTLPSAEPASVPASVPVTVHSDFSSAADQSAPEQTPDTDKWVIVDQSEKKPFKCGYPKCTKRYKHRGSLKEHIDVHTGILRYECTHPECNEYFANYSVLKKHIRAKHTTKRPYRCDICKQRFTRTESLMYHRRNVHSVRDEKKQPQNSNSTDKWIMYSGDETRPFQCGYKDCGRTYKKKPSLRRHFLSHIGDSQLRCYTGDCTGAISYCDSQALARHVHRQHTMKRPFACDICSVRYGRGDHLKRHKEHAHSTENEQDSVKKQKPPPKRERK